MLRSEVGDGTATFFFFFLGVLAGTAPAFGICDGGLLWVCLGPGADVCFKGVKSTGLRPAVVEVCAWELFSVLAFVTTFFFLAGVLGFRGDLAPVFRSCSISVTDFGHLVAGEPCGELFGLIGREKLTESLFRALFASSVVFTDGTGGGFCVEEAFANAPDPLSRLTPLPCVLGGVDKKLCGGSTEAGLLIDLAGICGGDA